MPFGKQCSPDIDDSDEMVFVFSLKSACRNVGYRGPVADLPCWVAAFSMTGEIYLLTMQPGFCFSPLVSVKGFNF